MDALPNLNAGHLEGCVTRAVFPDGGRDVPPALVVVACVDGCPHRSVVLEPREE